jgi:hypothetical protein
VLHDKGHGIATLATAETLEYPLGRGYNKRGCLLGVKWTAGLIVRALTAQGYKVIDHLDNVGGCEYFLDGQTVNHGLLIACKLLEICVSVECNCKIFADFLVFLFKINIFVSGRTRSV